MLRRLLNDGELDPRDRLAGCLLLLLYAQPLTRTAALRTSEVAPTAEGQTSITLARAARSCCASRSARSRSPCASGA